MRYAIVVLLGLLPYSSYSQELVEFGNGQVADADDINANFNSLKQVINAINVEAGATLLTDEEQPNESTGATGDIYIDTTTYYLYGPKLESGWGNGVSLIGPAGLDGRDGEQGPKGDTGATGATGPVGLTGPQGEQGPKGDTGATGATGPVGLTGPQGEQGPKGDTGEQGPEGLAGNDGTSCSSAQDGSNVLISCDDGTSGLLASGECSAEQSGSDVLIVCSSGSTATLRSAGVVVVGLPEGEVGEIIDTFYTGDIVVKDYSDVLLGEYIAIGSTATTFKMLTDKADATSGRELYVNNDIEAVYGVVSGGQQIWFENADCEGAVFFPGIYNDTEDLAGVTYPNAPDSASNWPQWFTFTNEHYTNKLVASYRERSSCTNYPNYVISNAELLALFSPCRIH